MLPIKYKQPTISLFSDFFDDDFIPNIFRGFFEFPFSTFNTSSIMNPPHDIIENEKEYIIELSLAGIKKEDISLNLDHNVLTIKAERKEVNDQKYNRKQTFYGKYQKSFTLPESIDIENIQAAFENGILKLNIPKLEKEEKFTKHIEIK
jgi:HSP20 family protein